MAVITPTLLGSINNALTLAFNTQLYAAESVYGRFCYDATSTGAAEVYPRLDMLKGIEEWIGARDVQALTQSSFTITNRKFQQSISVSRSDITDDRYGIYKPVAEQMGQNAQRFPDLLVTSLMKASTTTLGIDGQAFFSTTHPSYDGNGNPIQVSNYAAGNSPGWYLVDNSQVLKPWIFQRREAFELVAKLGANDDYVFFNDAYLWGTRGRCNAGLGLWQLAYYSTQPLSVTNLIAARTAMAQIRRPDGTPMGITPNLLIVPSTLYPLANSYYKAPLIGSDPTAPTTLVQNEVLAMFEPLELKWLN